MTGEEILPLDKTTVISKLELYIHHLEKHQKSKQKKALYKHTSGNANSFGKIINPADLFIKMKIMN